jgi:predicted nucleotide-binding protein
MYRGRQNVILEVGFFFGKLGWDNVYPLYKAPRIQARFEWPSDIAGTTNRQSYDDSGEWKEFLQDQLRAKGLL